MDTTYRLYENRNNALIEAREVMSKGYVSKTHSLEVCRICAKNHKEEIDSLIDVGMPIRTIARKMKWWYEECGFYRVFPSEASLRRYIKNRYRQRRSKQKYEERKGILHGHIQTCEEIMERIDKVLDMEQKGLAGHKEVLSVLRLGIWFMGKVAKDIHYLNTHDIYGSNCHFKPSGI